VGRVRKEACNSCSERPSFLLQADFIVRNPEEEKEILEILRGVIREDF